MISEGDAVIPVLQESSVLPESPSPVIRIVVADDHPIIRDAVRQLLEDVEDIKIVGEASNGREALDQINLHSPHVLLLDLKMPIMDGISVLQALQAAGTKIKIIVFTASEDKNEYVQAMKLGCSGIVLKQTDPKLIAKSIRKVAGGEIWLDSNTTAAVMRQFASNDGPVIGGTPSPAVKARERNPLSQREREIVALVAQGYKNKEMAEKMFISEQTVKNHLHNIFDKLGVSDRLELALYAIHKGLHVQQ